MNATPTARATPPIPSARPRRIPILSPTARRRLNPAFGWMNSNAMTPPMPRAYQAAFRRTDWRTPRIGSSYSGAPKAAASTRSMTTRNVSPRPTSVRSVSSTRSGLVRAEHRQEGFLLEFDGTDPLHAPLALFLLFEQLP